MRAGRTLFCNWFGRVSAAERVLSQDPCCCRRRTASGFACPSCTAGNCIEKGGEACGGVQKGSVNALG